MVLNKPKHTLSDTDSIPEKITINQRIDSLPSFPPIHMHNATNDMEVEKKPGQVENAWWLSPKAEGKYVLDIYN